MPAAPRAAAQAREDRSRAYRGAAERGVEHELWNVKKKEAPRGGNYLCEAQPLGLKLRCNGRKAMKSESGIQIVRSTIATLVLAATALTIRAQDFTLEWSTIDGGGGTSTGGQSIG